MKRFGVSEHEDGYWYMRPDEDGEWVSYHDHEQALAEKDRKIEAKDTELGKQDAELIVLHAAYQQLMEKAMQFAEELVAIAQANCEYHPEAEAFLQEHGQ